MRALTVRRPGDVLLERRDDPRPGAGELLIAPVVVGMCGTDLDIIDGTIDPAFVRYPIVLGHEWAGQVVTGNEAIPAGARVVVEGLLPCGHCSECLAGATNRCQNYDEFGFTRDGAAADLLVAPAPLVHRSSPTSAGSPERWSNRPRLSTARWIAPNLLPAPACWWSATARSPY